MKSFRCLVALLFCLLSQAALPALPAEFFDADGRSLQILHGGWSLWDPYQFVRLGQATRIEATLDEMVGIDFDITNTVARTAGFAVVYQYRPWPLHLAQLQQGEADLASGGGPQYAAGGALLSSIPYRYSTTVLYQRRDHPADLSVASVTQLLQVLADTDLRLGVLDGRRYGDEALDAFLDDAGNGSRIVSSPNDYENFRRLMRGDVDLLLADQLAGMSAVWRGGWERQVALQPFRLGTELSFLFSAATASPALVARFNDAISTLQQNGDIDSIIAGYQLPVLLGRVLDSDWFLVLDAVGTMAFALSGVLIAIKERYSLLGAMVLAALPAVGGGTVRDLLVGREPLAVLSSPLYLVLVMSTVMAGYLALRLYGVLRRRLPGVRKLRVRMQGRVVAYFYEVSDAIGLAAFTVTGVAVAISTQTKPLWLWAPVLAMLTAAGGGILRDVVRQATRIESLHSAFYAEVPLLWGLALALFLMLGGPRLDPDLCFLAILIALAGAFATRMTVVHLRLSSPAFT